MILEVAQNSILFENQVWKARSGDKCRSTTFLERRDPIKEYWEDFWISGQKSFFMGTKVCWWHQCESGGMLLSALGAQVMNNKAGLMPPLNFIWGFIYAFTRYVFLNLQLVWTQNIFCRQMAKNNPSCHTSRMIVTPQPQAILGL